MGGWRWYAKIGRVDRPEKLDGDVVKERGERSTRSIVRRWTAQVMNIASGIWVCCGGDLTGVERSVWSNLPSPLLAGARCPDSGPAALLCGEVVDVGGCYWIKGPADSQADVALVVAAWQGAGYVPKDVCVPGRVLRPVDYADIHELGPWDLLLDPDGISNCGDEAPPWAEEARRRILQTHGALQVCRTEHAPEGFIKGDGDRVSWPAIQGGIEYNVLGPVLSGDFCWKDQLPAPAVVALDTLNEYLKRWAEARWVGSLLHAELQRLQHSAKTLSSCSQTIIHSWFSWHNRADGYAAGTVFRTGGTARYEVVECGDRLYLVPEGTPLSTLELWVTRIEAVARLCSSLQRLGQVGLGCLAVQHSPTADRHRWQSGRREVDDKGRFTNAGCEDVWNTWVRGLLIPEVERLAWWGWELAETSDQYLDIFAAADTVVRHGSTAVVECRRVG
jgi:hypothetical protein